MARKGEKHHFWKGDDVSYKAIHDWLFKHYGRADHCENLDCKHTSIQFEWSLLKGFKHGHYRERYWQLCKSCHRSYDKTEESKEQARKALLGHPSWNKWEKLKRGKNGQFMRL